MIGHSERSPATVSAPDVLTKDDVIVSVTAAVPSCRPRMGIVDRRWRWVIAAGVSAMTKMALATWIVWFAIHRISWLGPWLADTGRAIVGTDAVSRLEEVAYDLEDRWNLWRHRGEKPAAHWSIPDAPSMPEVALGAVAAPASSAELRLFLPKDVGPLFREVAAKGDGVWVPVADFAEGDEPVVLYKTLLHPDLERSFAEVFIVAVDLRRARLHAVAGTVEPEASTDEGRRYVRTGLIPAAHRGSLVAAFNGGFKTEHGRYGMKVDTVTLLAARDKACAVARFADGRLAIGSWSSMAPSADEMTWWRQAPACMVEEGALHAGLASATATSWGTALGGGTVVRRSAIGLSERGDILYVAVSNATNARALARAMRHAGASSVAQLDINWSYPHIVTFHPSATGAPEGDLLFDGFSYEEKTYLERRSRRDFFYVTREPSTQRAQMDEVSAAEKQARAPARRTLASE
jgi:hypothetical protein